ncbi:MAG: EF-P lysine aminoacylase GenX [Planctomycetes bacterium]|nr:EF-P lysine aminoacylase GenX [Planctomycetota bacterium]
MTHSAADFRPTSSLAMLRLRAAMLAFVRRFFDERGYVEVDTPALSRDVVVDAYLEPFVVESSGWRLAAAQRAARPVGPRLNETHLFLQPSPEFHMKRLLAAGATAIYQIAHAFRHGEAGRLHNPEFTLVEWYRVGDTHHDQMTVVEDLTAQFFAADVVREHVPARPDLPRPFERIAYDDAFRRYAGTRVLDLSPRELAALAARHDIAPPPGLDGDDRDGWLNLLLAEFIEPRLGRERPTFLYNYPASQAALARLNPQDPRTAERFELYVNGIELANGYHELTDDQELRDRMHRQAELRERDGRRRLPMENRLLDAMEAGLPACAGVALGFDRLLMLAVGEETLAEVVAFPFERA